MMVPVRHVGGSNGQVNILLGHVLTTIQSRCIPIIRCIEFHFEHPQREETSTSKKLSLWKEIMSSMTFGQKTFTPTPPDKGSFPLDHEGECKRFMVHFMRCLRENNNDNSKCRIEIKNYLGCRMDKQLMAREDWETLGLADVDSHNTKEAS